MRKGICLLLVIMMVTACVCAFAEEGAGGENASEETSFLVIQGEDPVPVYESVADREKADELKPGQVCGLIREVTEAGVKWFHIVYVNSARKGASGFICPDQARILSLAEFKKLLGDSDKANEVMDLLDAVEEYLDSVSAEKEAGNSVAGNETANHTAGAFRDFYNQGMKALQDAFSLDFSEDLKQLEEKEKELAGKAADAVTDIVETVADGAEKLMDTAVDSAESLKEAAEEEIRKHAEGTLPEAAEDISALLDDVLDMIRDVESGELAEADWQGVQDRLQELNGKLGEVTGDAGEVLQEKLEEILDRAEEVLGYGQTASAVLSELPDVYRENGFLSTTESLLGIIRMLIGDTDD